GTTVPDLNSGLRVFKRSLFLKYQHLLPNGFSFTTTITVASLFAGKSVLYVPIQYAHRSGDSHIKPVRDFFGFVLLICRLVAYFDPLKFFLPMAALLLVLG